MRTGLRVRITAVVAATGVLTMAVAAIALITPLEHRLRNDEVAALARDVRELRPSLKSTLGSDDRPSLRKISRSLKRRTDAEVEIISSHQRVLVATDTDEVELYPEIARAFATGKTQRVIGRAADGRLEARVTTPVHTKRGEFSVVLVKGLAEAAAARDVVARALIIAAIIALGVALPLGFLLATRLVRRLSVLRDNAHRVAELGPAVELQPDPSHDEIGDLSRAFVTMQERLRHQEEARKTFVATASHELRTPLASLRLMLDGLRQDLDSETPDLAGARDQAERASRQSERLASLSNDLLELSHIDSGREFRHEPVDLGELVRSVLAEFETRARGLGVDFAVTAPQPVWAAADPSSTAQIVRILVDNGLRFSPAGTPLEITIAADTARARIVVADRGPGVAEEERSRIFERFTRGPETDDHAGFGLGLAVGHELAEHMHGALVLEPSDAGARFVLELERVDAP